MKMGQISQVAIDKCFTVLVFYAVLKFQKIQMSVMEFISSKVVEWGNASLLITSKQA